MKVWINFIEEFVMNPDYDGYVGGRVEVYKETGIYAIEEIRFFTNKPAFEKFRKKWDWKSLNEKKLTKFRKKVEEKFYKVPKVRVL